MKNSQKMEILEYLQTHNGITQREAIDNFGCLRLAARISDLREDGHNILSARIKVKDPHGNPTQVARYSLVKGA